MPVANWRQTVGFYKLNLRGGECAKNVRYVGIILSRILNEYINKSNIPCTHGARVTHKRRTTTLGRLGAMSPGYKTATLSDFPLTAVETAYAFKDRVWTKTSSTHSATISACSSYVNHIEKPERFYLRPYWTPPRSACGSQGLLVALVHIWQ